jgi:hypothetical protein
LRLWFSGLWLHVAWQIATSVLEEPAASIIRVGKLRKSSARRATQLLNLRPYKTTVIQALQPCDPTSRVHFCSWFLHSCHQRWDRSAIDRDSIFNTSCDLWIVNHFILNVTGQQAYWFTSKIRMCLRVSGALVAVKCTAMNQSTKVRTFLYNCIIVK